MKYNLFLSDFRFKIAYCRLFHIAPVSVFFKIIEQK